MRILYAANNSYCSFHQLDRLLNACNHEIKVAGYKKSMGTRDIDFTLDALFNFSNPSDNCAPNGNNQYLCNEIKRFKPNLIISDLEPFTSLIALELGIKLWQASPSLLYYALQDNVIYDTSIYKHHTFLFDGAKAPRKTQTLKHIIDNSDRKLVVSHLCDIKDQPKLKPTFEFARPDFILADSWDQSIDRLDSSSTSYKDDLGKCEMLASNGAGMILADAFYNQKFSVMRPNRLDVESVVCSYTNEYYGLGKIEVDTNTTKSKPINIVLDNNIKFLHEHIG